MNTEGYFLYLDCQLLDLSWQAPTYLSEKCQLDSTNRYRVGFPSPERFQLAVVRNLERTIVLLSHKVHHREIFRIGKRGYIAIFILHIVKRIFGVSNSRNHDRVFRQIPNFAA